MTPRFRRRCGGPWTINGTLPFEVGSAGAHALSVCGRVCVPIKEITVRVLYCFLIVSRSGRSWFYWYYRRVSRVSVSVLLKVRQLVNLVGCVCSWQRVQIALEDFVVFLQVPAMEMKGGGDGMGLHRCVVLGWGEDLRLNGVPMRCQWVRICMSKAGEGKASVLLRRRHGFLCADGAAVPDDVL